MSAHAEIRCPIVPKHISLVPIPRPQPNVATLPVLVMSLVAPNAQASSVVPGVSDQAATENEGSGPISKSTIMKHGSARDAAPTLAAPIPVPIATALATAPLTSTTDSACQNRSIGGKRSVATSSNISDRPSKCQRRPLMDITAINNKRSQANKRVIRPTEKLREQ